MSFPTKTIYFTAGFILIAALAGFYLLRSKQSVDPQPAAKIIYQIRHMGQKNGEEKADYHAVNLDGTGDTVIHTMDSGANVLLLDHTAILAATSVFDATGKSLDDQYKSLGFEQMISLSSNASPIYSEDKNRLALFFVPTKSTSSPAVNAVDIEILDIPTGTMKNYPCEVCVTYSPDYKTLDGFSPNGRDLYYSLRRNPAPQQSRAEPDEKFFTLDTVSGDTREVAIPWHIGDYHTIYPHFGRVVKITNPVGISLRDATTSLALVSLTDFSEKQLITDSIISTRPIFDGTDIVYTANRMTTATSGVNVITGVNSVTGKQYSITDTHMSDHPADAILLLKDFVPNSKTFLYEILTGSHTSEIRAHDIDTGKDWSLLKSENLTDRTSDMAQYIGVIF